jgi:hypothetical protein
VTYYSWLISEKIVYSIVSAKCDVFHENTWFLQHLQNTNHVRPVYPSAKSSPFDSRIPRTWLISLKPLSIVSCNEHNRKDVTLEFQVISTHVFLIQSSCLQNPKTCLHDVQPRTMWGSADWMTQSLPLGHLWWNPEEKVPQNRYEMSVWQKTGTCLDRRSDQPVSYSRYRSSLDVRYSFYSQPSSWSLSILPLYTSQIFNGLIVKGSRKTWSLSIIICPLCVSWHDKTCSLSSCTTTPLSGWWSEMVRVCPLRRCSYVPESYLRSHEIYCSLTPLEELLENMTPLSFWQVSDTLTETLFHSSVLKDVN